VAVKTLGRGGAELGLVNGFGGDAFFLDEFLNLDARSGGLDLAWSGCELEDTGQLLRKA
jgi:hypothetical protein